MSLRRRVMLKISGEALQGGMGFGVDPQVVLLMHTMQMYRTFSSVLRDWSRCCALLHGKWQRSC